jgi:ATP-dependent Clp protease ATP-binding subunit ClpC
MFERFTDRARRVVVLAQEEARLLNHNCIMAGHLILGMMHEGECIPAQILAESVIDDVRKIVDARHEGDKRGSSGHLPFTVDCKDSLERSLREALALGHNYIAPEHIFLAVIKNHPGVLIAAGLDLERMRLATLEAMPAPPPPKPAPKLRAKVCPVCEGAGEIHVPDE